MEGVKKKSCFPVTSCSRDVGGNVISDPHDVPPWAPRNFRSGPPQDLGGEPAPGGDLKMQGGNHACSPPKSQTLGGQPKKASPPVLGGESSPMLGPIQSLAYRAAAGLR